MLRLRHPVQTAAQVTCPTLVLNLAVLVALVGTSLVRAHAVTARPVSTVKIKQTRTVIPVIPMNTAPIRHQYVLLVKRGSIEMLVIHSVKTVLPDNFHRVGILAAIVILGTSAMVERASVLPVRREKLVLLDPLHAHLAKLVDTTHILTTARVTIVPLV